MLFKNYVLYSLFIPLCGLQVYAHKKEDHHLRRSFLSSLIAEASATTAFSDAKVQLFYLSANTCSSFLLKMAENRQIIDINQCFKQKILLINAKTCA